jgi:hypothetical protein
MFSSFCINPVLIQATGTTNVLGDDVQAASPGTSYMASVQQASASAQRDAYRQGSTAAYVVMFDQEPLDTSIGADHPRLRTRDLVTWQVNPADPTTWRAFVVSGPVRDEGGGGVAWSVDCAEIA